MAKYIMALDAGTRPAITRCILFDKHGPYRKYGSKEFTQYFPKPGWVWRMMPMRSLSTQLGVAVEAMQKAGASAAGYCGHRNYQSKRNGGSVG